MKIKEILIKVTESDGIYCGANDDHNILCHGIDDDDLKYNIDEELHNIFGNNIPKAIYVVL